MRIKMTYALAMAVAKDAANDRMRNAGRTCWNEDDYNFMVETFDRLYPVSQHIADITA